MEALKGSSIEILQRIGRGRNVYDAIFPLRVEFERLYLPHLFCEVKLCREKIVANTDYVSFNLIHIPEEPS